MIRIAFLLLLTLTPALAQRKNRTAPASPGPTSSTLANLAIPDTTRYRTMVLAKGYGDSVFVRWAPDNATLWRAANVRGGGYLLTRRSINTEGKLVLDYQKAIRPWTIDQWKQRCGPRDTLAGACVQLLYGKRDLRNSTGEITLNKALRQHEQNQYELALVLLEADVNARHAQGLGLGFMDKDVKKGTTYIYALLPLVTDQKMPVDLGKTMVRNEAPEPRTPFIELRGESGDRQVRVTWDRKITDMAYTAFLVERSTDGGRTFRRLTRRPWIQPPTKELNLVYAYTDSTARNYQPYQYRVIGITPFGEQSLPSPVLTVRSVDQTPPSRVEKIDVSHLGGSRVRINWTHLKPPGDLRGYQISKAASIDGPFVSLTRKPLAANKRTFTDSTAIPYQPAFYQVIAVDTSGNENPSLPIYCTFNDTKGPAKPKNLQGYIDTTGFVRIVWDPNPETDLLGYAVVMANDPAHIFTARTSGYLALSLFNDQTELNTLSRRLCYRVIAYDKNHNPSQPSDILILTRPDRVRPEPPIFTRYVASDTAMNLVWARSSSTDVREQLLLRRGAPTERWHEVARLSPAHTTYADKLVKSNTAYTYALMSVDSAGLRSDVSPVLDLKTLTLSAQPVTNLTTRLSADGKQVILSWKYPNDLCRFVIYRASMPSPLRTYNAVNREQTFTDKAIQKGKYEYAVKVIYQDGRESGLSNRVKIDIN
ncbi:fibronectin type III domain-containing protein [Spirosoma gilvum]